MDAILADVPSTLIADHARIKASLDHLFAELDESRPPADFTAWKVGLLWGLRDFQALLWKHFDLEEEGGFSAELIRIAPHRAHRIHQVEGEHRTLMAALGHLITALKRMDRLTDVRLARLHDHLAELAALLRAHEAAECALVQDVYYDDFGAGD